MAHNLNINKTTGKVSFMSVKEKPWHMLGTVLDNPATSEEAIREAGLDFEVRKSPAIVRMDNPDGSFTSKEVPDRFATYRTDSQIPFGIVGSRYEIVQNRDAFAFFDAIVGEGEAIYETAGALGDGETIFITAKLPSYIKVGKDDAIDKYLLLTSTHNGSGSIQAMFTPVRVVCANTLNAALKSATTKVSIRHTKSAHNNLKEAHKVLGIANKLSEELEGIFNQMSKVRITDKQLKDYIETVVLGNTVDRMLNEEEKFELSTRSSNIISSIYNFSQVGVGQDMDTTKGTVFGAYNAITGYYQNVKNYNSQEDKMKSVMLGNGYDTGQKALVLAYDFIK